MKRNGHREKASPPQAKAQFRLPDRIHEVLAGAEQLFRGESIDNPQAGFDRARQIEISTGCIEYLRSGWSEEWKRARATLGAAVRSKPEHRGIREFRNRLSLAIRVADESADFLYTVAFISQSVVDTLNNERANGKLKKSSLDRTRFAHEHGVPVDAIARILLHEKNEHCDFRMVLDTLSCRAILSKEAEAKLLDKYYKTKLPTQIKTATGWIPLTAVPLRFYALARYHVVNPKLVEYDLVPTCLRAQRLLDEFLDFIMRPSHHLPLSDATTDSILRIHIPDQVLVHHPENLIEKSGGAPFVKSVISGEP